MGTDSAINPDPTGTVPGKSKLFLVCVISGVWVLGLLIMAIVTTNLSVLNLRQIERASLIVTGVPTDAGSGRVSVISVWKGTINREIIVVENLTRTAATNGESWIFPLIESPQGDGNYKIAPYSGSDRGQDPNRPQGLLIYPASPELEQQLKSLLRADSD